MSTPARTANRLPQATFPGREPAQLADVLERVLDKGIVVAGDIQINLLDIELLTIKLRLLIASADKAREMGIDWWENDPFLGRGRRGRLESRIKRLEQAAGLGDGDREHEPEARDREEP
jgi:gas vesicle protein GvpA/GvpJ/GvpM family